MERPRLQELLEKRMTAETARQLSMATEIPSEGLATKHHSSTLHPLQLPKTHCLVLFGSLIVAARISEALLVIQVSSLISSFVAVSGDLDKPKLVVALKL
jgi:hypothetical protein